MEVAKNTLKPEHEDEVKTCFVIMPIADVDGYEKGHFKRVYEHVIKPACEDVGYQPIRADEVASSNYIVIDIMKKIVESDLVVCDLSGRNPNVLYELGVRQAFNLPTVLIKDDKTNRIFDIQGIRTVDYNESLRTDIVIENKLSISNAITETIENTGKDINSLINLLGIKAAQVPNNVNLTQDTSIILSAIKDLSSRINNLENGNKSNTRSTTDSLIDLKKRLMAKPPESRDGKYRVGDSIFYNNDDVGEVVDIAEDGVIVRQPSGQVVLIHDYAAEYQEGDTSPF